MADYWGVGGGGVGPVLALVDNPGGRVDEEGVVRMCCRVKWGGFVL